MKRKCLLSILLCLSLFLCGCALGGGESQFTQLDSQYLQSEETQEEVQDSQPASELDDTEMQGEADAGIEQESDTSQIKSASELEKEKKIKRDSIEVEDEKKETKSNSKAEKKTNSKSKGETEQETFKKEEKKNSTSSSKDKSAKKKDNDKKQTDKSFNKETEPVSTSKPESTPDTDKPFCTISIDCYTILSNLSELKSEKKDFVPKDGWILKDTKVTLEDGDTAYDILYKVCREYKIHMEAAYTPAYGTYYVEGINQLYEFDCGDLSGWTYLVNGQSLNYGCFKYKVKAGDVIQWRFSCNAGRDVK